MTVRAASVDISVGFWPLVSGGTKPGMVNSLESSIGTLFFRNVSNNAALSALFGAPLWGSFDGKENVFLNRDTRPEIGFAVLFDVCICFGLWFFV
jgi:hypothetical protein